MITDILNCIASVPAGVWLISAYVIIVGFAIVTYWAYHFYKHGVHAKSLTVFVLTLISLAQLAWSVCDIL